MAKTPEPDKPGLIGKLYSITVLPETMDEWIEELYRRVVPKAEAKDVAQYLLDSLYKSKEELAKDLQDEPNNNEWPVAKNSKLAQRNRLRAEWRKKWGIE